MQEYLSNGEQIKLFIYSPEIKSVYNLHVAICLVMNNFSRAILLKYLYFILIVNKRIVN